MIGGIGPVFNTRFTNRKKKMEGQYFLLKNQLKHTVYTFGLERDVSQ